MRLLTMNYEQDLFLKKSAAFKSLIFKKFNATQKVSNLLEL